MRAKTTIARGLVIVHLQECLTVAERTLVAAGLSAQVTLTRDALHEAIRPEATAIVEALSGRHVVAYLSAQHSDPDHAVIAFVTEQTAPVT